MNQKYLIANSLLWATAIVASAIVGAPVILSGVLLPALGAGSLLIMQGRNGSVARCQR